MLIGRILFALAAIFVILFFVFIIVAIVRLIKKKTVKIYFLLSIVSLLACIVSIYLGITLLEQAYQDDCDVVRLQHLSYYGNLIDLKAILEKETALKGLKQLKLFLKTTSLNIFSFDYSKYPNEYQRYYIKVLRLCKQQASIYYAS